MMFVLRHAHVGVADLGVAVLVVVAEHRQVALDDHAGRVERDEDHRVLRVARAVGVRNPHHDGDLAARVHRAAAPPLAPVDHVLVAVGDDRRRHVRGVARGDVRLGHPEARADLALEQRLQPALLLLRRPEHREHLHVAGVRRSAVDRLGGDLDAATGDLGERRVLEVRQPGAVLLVGQEEVPEALRARFDLQLLDDRRHDMRVALASLARIDRLGRVDVLVHEARELLLQRERAFGVGEVHVDSLLVGRGRRRGR